MHLVRAGLAPEPQLRVRSLGGAVIARVDLGFERERVAVEYDGAWHGEWRRIGPDRERLNRLHAAGWAVVFVTARRLRDPVSVVAMVRTAPAMAAR